MVCYNCFGKKGVIFDIIIINSFVMFILLNIKFFYFNSFFDFLKFNCFNKIFIYICVFEGFENYIISY